MPWIAHETRKKEEKRGADNLPSLLPSKRLLLKENSVPLPAMIRQPW